jgi:SPP1 family predicted phage head-tail adaptor
MRAGQLRTPLDVYRRIESHNDSGDLKLEYQWFGRVRGKVTMEASAESSGPGKMTGPKSYLAVIRYRRDWPTSDMRLRTVDGLTLEVTGVLDPDGKKRELQLTCRECVK